MAVLMGANARTYKFALGSAILELATAGREAVTHEELAVPYALRLAERAAAHPQGPGSSVRGESDFLAVLKQEGPPTLATGRPTERLLAAAAASMPGMVMQKFHNIRGTGELAHRFYEMAGRGAQRRVILTTASRDALQHQSLLAEELSARWSIVECCFDAGIGRQLVQRGVVLGADGSALVAPVRRVAVASARSGLVGFQHGRCFYCGSPVEHLADVHVDHVYPFMLMRSRSWRGPELNGVWNLVVACVPCNLAKSARLPTESEVRRLISRNDAIAGSPHPLRRSLELGMRGAEQPLATTGEARLRFIKAVDALVTDGRHR